MTILGTSSGVDVPTAEAVEVKGNPSSAGRRAVALVVLQIAVVEAFRLDFASAAVRGQRNAIYWNNPRNHTGRVTETFSVSVSGRDTRGVC